MVETLKKAFQEPQTGFRLTLARFVAYIEMTEYDPVSLSHLILKAPYSDGAVSVAVVIVLEVAGTALNLRSPQETSRVPPKAIERQVPAVRLECLFDHPSSASQVAPGVAVFLIAQHLKGQAVAVVVSIAALPKVGPFPAAAQRSRSLPWAVQPQLFP